VRVPNGVERQMKPVRIALAQIDSVVGDLAGNRARILRCAREAAGAGAEVLLTPELSLCGYPPEDLVLRESFLAACEREAALLARDLASLPGLHAIVGHPGRVEGRRCNCASLLVDGAIAGTYAKRELPNYDVFDEQRTFAPGGRTLGFEIRGTRFAVAICEDTWYDRIPGQAAASGAQVLLVPNGSPWNVGKSAERLEVMRRNVSAQGLAIAYANQVGGQDELVFDGGSFVLDAQGAVRARAPAFAEHLLLADFEGGVPRPGTLAPEPGADEALWQALLLGLRDYIAKNGFPGVLVGLSGGVDSALTLALACDALGPGRVRAVLMPSRFTAPMSIEDARALAQNLGASTEVLPIEAPFESFLSLLAPPFAGRPWDTTEENLQARVRGMILMALSNKTGSIVLTTGNKSEMAVGYCTLYGDMAGGFAVIKDLTKNQVYRLCRYRNGLGEVIPARILDRAPSAELRENQTDQDTLPAYDLLDEVITRYMERGEGVPSMIAAGLPAEPVRRIVRWIRTSEYKRRQAPVGIRVSPRAFGRDWRYPITNRFREEEADGAGEA